MLTFKPVAQRDMSRLRRYYKDCDYQLCEYSALVKLMWRGHLHPQYAEAAGCLIVKNCIDGKYCFDYPVPGPDGDEDAALCAAETESLSRLFSAPQNALCAAAERVLGELEAEKYARAAAERRYVEARLAAMEPCEGDLLFFEESLSPAALRALAEGGKMRCTGVCAALCAEDGGYRYVMASETVDLRAAARSINAALSGRGGGAPGMIQGSLLASREQIEEYFHGKIG